MRIVIDARMLQESGIGRYIRNLVDQLQIIDQENEYFILHLQEDFHKLSYKQNFRKILADFRWYGLTEQIKLFRIVKLLKPDLVHFPHFNVPVFYQGKFVVTIHDLIHQHFSMARATTHGPVFYQLKRIGYRKVFSTAVQKAKKILVPSEFIKNQLMDDWNINREKVVVTYEAVDEKIIKHKSKIKNQKLLKHFNIEKPYIFYVGNAHPHKNVEGLIKAFGNLRVKYPNLSLVLAGSDHYFWQKIKTEFQQAGIIYTGYVSDNELVELYKNAWCFVMPSFEEGFGIPILEAMACGCPVVSSNRGSLPEVAGHAVIYFDPGNQVDMVNKINIVLESENIRQELIKKGLKRYKQFSWKKLAQQTLEVYKQCG